MRLTVVAGEKQVSISIKGHSVKTLRRAEAIAFRLLADSPEPESPRRIGFAAHTDTAISGQAEAPDLTVEPAVEAKRC